MNGQSLQLYNQPINTTVIEGLLQKTCKNNQNTLPLKITITGSQLQTLLQQQLLQNPPQHILICLQDGKCYGTILDKLITQKILSTGTLTRYAVSCTAATTLCESLRGAAFGLVFGAVESIATCAIPAVSAHLAKNKILETVEENPDTVKFLPTTIPVLGTAAGIQTTTVTALYRTRGGYQLLKRAAEILLQGEEKKGKQRFTAKLARRNAEKIIDSFLENSGLKDYIPRDEAARVIARASPEDLRLLAAAKELGIAANEGEIKRFVAALAKGEGVEEARKKIIGVIKKKMDAYMEGLVNKRLRELARTLTTERIGEIQKKYYRYLTETKGLSEDEAMKAANKLTKDLIQLKKDPTLDNLEKLKDYGDGPAAFAEELESSIATQVADEAADAFKALVDEGALPETPLRNVIEKVVGEKGTTIVEQALHEAAKTSFKQDLAYGVLCTLTGALTGTLSAYAPTLTHTTPPKITLSISNNQIIITTPDGKTLTIG